MMCTIVEKARTINEKMEGYHEDSKVDYSYLKEWRNVRSLLNDKCFNRMLKECNISKRQFAYALQPNNEEEILKGDEWFQKFTEIMNGFDYEQIDYSVGVYLPALPFSKYLINEIRRTISELNELKVSEKVIDAFASAHITEMFNIIGKIVAIKLEEYKQSHSFSSEDKTERFQEFLKATFNSKDSFVKLYEEYPVAARVATIRTMFLRKNYIELLCNIDNDYLDIKTFIKKNELKLTEIQLSTGDSHEQGNSVTILKFEDKKLVYKPKNLEISTAFEKFIDWYVQSSKLLPIKIPKGIYKKDYTYNEFITPDFCKNEGEVERFYIRYGYLIAICYLFNINDLHLENIIAHGEYPVIIDIETAFQVSTEMERKTLYIDLLKHLEIDSVSNSFLLPKQISVGADKEIELSALIGKEVKLSQTFLAPTELNTDQFHYKKVPGYFAGGNNIPKINEAEVNVKKYSLKILEGFEEFIYFILKHKRECLEILNEFKGKKVRSLIKGTERYAAMIRYANHPAYNQEMKYRERLMMNNWAYPYTDKRIIKSEVRDMLFNDIPIFYSYTDSLDLIDSQENIYENYYEQSGYSIVQRRIERLTEKEILRQRAIILSKLGIYDVFLNQNIVKRKMNFIEYKFDYVKQAERIADYLFGEAFVKDKKCSFINVDCDKKKRWFLTPCDESLYGGVSGIAVFFLELYMQTSREKYYDYYRMLINTAVEQTRNTTFVSAFNGWLSPIYPLLLEYKYLGKMSNKDYFKFTIDKLESLDEEAIYKLKSTDYISGIAGIIRLLSLVRKFYRKHTVSEKTVKKFVDILKKKIELETEGAMNNIGIAHGISGIILGLASGTDIEPEEVKKALLMEYNMEMPKENIYKWCWGLSGMIQARLELLKLVPLGIDMTQLDTLIDRFYVIVSEAVSEDSLCHGNGSIATTIKMIYEYTKDEKWNSMLHMVMTNIYMNSLTRNYQIPEIEDIQAKGIFDGIAGIGWLYLYTHRSINNLLLLEIK